MAAAQRGNRHKSICTFVIFFQLISYLPVALDHLLPFDLPTPPTFLGKNSQNSKKPVFLLNLDMVAHHRGQPYKSVCVF